MDDWLTRFDDLQVTREHVAARLPHRVRVAWAAHQLAAVAAGMSRYYRGRAGFDVALRIARRFWQDGVIDPQEVGEALITLGVVVRVLELEGYSLDATLAGMGLLHSAIDPDPRPDVQFGDPSCRLPVDPQVVHKPEAYVGCATSAAFLAGECAMLYAHLQFWWQGVTFDPNLEPYYDEFQGRFFRFSQACFDIAARVSEADLTEDTFRGVKLDWSLHRPVPDIERMFPAVAPPAHDRVRPANL